MDRRSWGLLGLVAMLVADVVLVAWAVGLLPGGSDPGPAPEPAAVSARSSSSSTSASTTPAGSASPFVLAVVDDEAAWRSTRGECNGARPVLERTTDGGASWERVDLPGARVLRMRFAEPSVGFVVSTGEDCAPVVQTTGDAGQSWQPASAEQTWAALDGPEALVPGGTEVRVCGTSDLLALAPATDDSAWALCADGALRRSTDSGATWQTSGEVEGASSLAATAESLAVSGTGRGCDGSLVRTGSASSGELGEATCVEGARGAVLGLTGSGGWLVTKARTWHSADLTSWSPRD